MVLTFRLHEAHEVDDFWYISYTIQLRMLDKFKNKLGKAIEKDTFELKTLDELESFMEMLRKKGLQDFGLISQ